jgi:hypothetical protein
MYICNHVLFCGDLYIKNATFTHKNQKKKLEIGITPKITPSFSNTFNVFLYHLMHDQVLYKIC